MLLCAHLWIVLPSLCLPFITFLVFHYRQNHTQNEVSITGLVLEFENFEHDLLATVTELCTITNNVIIYSDTFIYPSVDHLLVNSVKTKCRVHLLEHTRSPYISHLSLSIQTAIEDFILLLPDGTRIEDPATAYKRLHHLALQLKASNQDGFLFAIDDKNNKQTDPSCLTFNFDVKQWTLVYNISDKTKQWCHYEHPVGLVLLIKKASLLKLHHPLGRPFLTSLCIQAQLFNLSLSVQKANNLFVQGKKLFVNQRVQAKHKHLERHRLIALYHRLGIKKVLHNDNSTEWHGCTRHSSRCFGTIVNDIPEYLVQGRWLPPCCMFHLKLVGRYIMQLLDNFNVRYWLEGGSLLGAARDGQIIKWDYDIDLGIYREDASKFAILEKLLSSDPGYQIEDGQGFLWERALEGDFIKVHYSAANRIHVDIFPFYSHNGTMTKDTWLFGHPQDMPFPERFLQPLDRINFIDMSASAPNNVRQFLELKFGKGAIENPSYPRNISINHFYGQFSGEH